MLDLMIRGGTIVTPDGAGHWEIGIAAGKIVAVAAPETTRYLCPLGAIPAASR